MGSDRQVLLRLTKHQTMKKNLLDPGVAEELLARAGTLKPYSKPLWGCMTASQMIRHCTLANRQIVDGSLAREGAIAFRQKLVRFLCLYVLPGFPKNKKGAASIETDHLVLADEDWTNLLEDYSASLSDFTRQSHLPFLHPAFGALSTRQWGLATWMHMDHHLRQFGV